MARLVIVGAGIGGLTTAHAVARAGHDAILLERAADPAEVGAGLVLWPRPVAALEALGVREGIEGVDAEEISITDQTGKALSTTKVGKHGRLLFVERPQLHAALVPGLEIRASAQVTAVDAGGVTLADGTRVEGDGVIGCDGIDSVVRRYVDPSAGVKDTGRVAVRSTSPVEIGAGRAHEAWGVGELFGAVGLAGGRSYWFYERNGGPADAREAATRFPEVYRRCVDATPDEAFLIHPIGTVGPLKSWSRGNVTLVGDAAHAMEPNLGQGAGSAIEDAAALQEVLAGTDDLAAAFGAYERARRKRVNLLFGESKRMAAMAMAGRATGLRNLVVRVVPSGPAIRRIL